MDKPKISTRMRELVMLAWYQFDKSRSGTIRASEILKLIEVMEGVLKMSPGSLISPEAIQETERFCISQPDLVVDMDGFISLFNQLTDDYLVKEEVGGVDAIHSDGEDESNRVGLGLGWGLRPISGSKSDRIMSTPVNGLSINELSQRLDSYDTETGVFDDLPRASDHFNPGPRLPEPERPSKLKIFQERRKKLQDQLSMVSPIPTSTTTPAQERVYKAPVHTPIYISPPMSRGNLSSISKFSNESTTPSYIRKLISEKDAQIENYESRAVQLQDTNSAIMRQLTETRRSIQRLQRELVELRDQVSHADHHCQLAQSEATKWHNEYERVKSLPRDLQPVVPVIPVVSVKKEDDNKGEIAILKERIKELETHEVESGKSHNREVRRLNDQLSELNQQLVQIPSVGSVGPVGPIKDIETNTVPEKAPVPDMIGDRLAHAALRRLAGAVDHQRQLVQMLSRGQVRWPTVVDIQKYTQRSLPLVALLVALMLILAAVKMTSLLIRTVVELVNNHRAFNNTNSTPATIWRPEYKTIHVLNPIGDITSLPSLPWWCGRRDSLIYRGCASLDQFVRDGGGIEFPV